jgi:Cfr10I/Bse634I restriction endonuclease
MPYRFSAEATEALPEQLRCIEDRRNNPVRNRDTKFRLRQQNMLAYTYPFVPGFTDAGINNMPYAELIEQPLRNAEEEGRTLFRSDFVVTNEQKAKVAGDIFEEVEASILWNAAARWNLYMRGGSWPSQPRYSRPSLDSDPARQVAAISLPRRYDWVRILEPAAVDTIGRLRAGLAKHQLLLPTSTPDILIVRLPASAQANDLFTTELPDLSLGSQRLLTDAYKTVQGLAAASDFILAIALKRSLRSDRLYQPLYEANIMQLLLEGALGAPQVDFEVHTLETAGTRATETYRAASLAAVATNHANPHRAVRDLYLPGNASELVRRFFAFLEARL